MLSSQTSTTKTLQSMTLKETISNILRRLKEELTKIGEEAFKQKALDNGVDISEV